MSSTACPSRLRKAFTVYELLVVVVIMGIIAVSATPVLSQSIEARQAAARDEVVRLLEYARGRAIATGFPAGVRVDTNESTLRLVTISEAGAIVDLSDPINGASMGANLSLEFAEVQISSFVNGDGNSGTGTVWFDYQAEPHTRDDVSGVFDAIFVQNATITLSTGVSVVVHADSGFVEDES